MKKQCAQCGSDFVGRSDKRFCGLACKNAFNIAQKKTTRDVVKEADGYLHRNREILAMLMGSDAKITLDKMILTRAGFKWDYMTGIYWNKENKMYRIVYDFAWMDFSDQKVLVVRKTIK